MCKALSLSLCVFVLCACGGAPSVVTAKNGGEASAPAIKGKATSVASTLNVDEVRFTVPNAELPSISIYTVAKNEESGAFTALVKLKAGTKVPLHAHSHDYTGAALSAGLKRGMTAESVVELPKGSAWVQKAGEGHINECSDKADCLMLVMFKGKLDMLPQDKPFAGEAKSKTVLGDAIEWIDLKKGGVKMLPLVGDIKTGPFDALFFFPAGLKTNTHAHTAAFSGALISGTHQRGSSAETLKTITAGAVWYQPPGAHHIEQCGAEQDCIFVGTSEGPLDTSTAEVSQ